MVSTSPQHSCVHSLFNFRCTEIDANAQISVVSNTDVINKIVSMMDQHLPETQEMYSLFCSQCASHGLFYCTWSSHTHHMFIEKGLHHEIIEITKHCMNDSAGDIVIRYRIFGYM